MLNNLTTLAPISPVPSLRDAGDPSTSASVDGEKTGLTRQTSAPIVPDGLTASADGETYAQAPSDILGAAGTDIEGALPALRRQGERAGLPAGHRYFTLVDRLPTATADPAGVGRALDTLLRLPLALERLAHGTPPLVPTGHHLARLTGSIGISACHQPLVKGIHKAVDSYLAESTPATYRALKPYLSTPVMADRILTALCDAAQEKGAGLSMDDHVTLCAAACGDVPRNLAFSAKACAQVQRYLDGGAEPAWAELVQEAGHIEDQERDEKTQASAAQDARALERPPFFGLAVQRSGDSGLTDAQFDSLPSPAEVDALAQAAAPGVPQPLRHMAPMDLRPYEITTLYQQDPQDCTRILPLVRIALYDPACTPVENALRFDIAARLLLPATGRVATGHQPVPDRLTGTFTFPAGAIGSANDVAVELPGRPDDRAFLDESYLACGGNHNGACFYLPEQRQPGPIDQGACPAPNKVVDVAHLASSVPVGDGADPILQFALRLQLPVDAGRADVDRLQAALGELLEPGQVARNGIASVSVTVAIRPAPGSGPGSFVDADGRPAFRCRPAASLEQLRAFLADAGLEQHFEIRRDTTAGAWTAVSIGIRAAAATSTRSILRNRDYVPMSLRQGLPAAIAYADSADAADAVRSSPELASMLQRWRRVLSTTEAAILRGGDFAGAHAAVAPLIDFRWEIQLALLACAPDSEQHRHLSILAQHAELALPVHERARLVARQ